MHPAKRWYWDTLGQRILNALEKNRIPARYFQDKKRATQFILEQIPPSAKVGVSGSVTIRELGLIELLEKRGNLVVHHWKPELGHDESGGRIESLAPGSDLGVRRDALNSGIYLCSTNAVTMDGKLVNVDGHGNRAAAMIFGPEEVVIIAGMNKVVKDVPAAIERIKTYTAPLSAHRGRAKVPCAETTVCVDCDAPQRSCSVTTIIEKRPKGANMLVILVGEELGF
jgi:hypothetical protein